jgi:hypothetical protein
MTSHQILLGLTSERNKTQKTTLESEKAYILLSVFKAADDGWFMFKMYASKYIHTAFLKPRDAVNGNINKSSTGMSYSTVSNIIGHQRGFQERELPVTRIVLHFL